MLWLGENIHIEELHIRKSEVKEMFEMEVKSNFPEVFDSYLTNQNHIPFYFCDYISKSQDIKNIKNEITAHMETNHEDIIEDIKTDNTGVENVIHLEFLDFFLSMSNYRSLYVPIAPFFVLQILCCSTEYLYSVYWII